MSATSPFPKLTRKERSARSISCCGRNVYCVEAPVERLRLAERIEQFSREHGLPERGCKPKPQKFPPMVGRVRIFPTRGHFGKVSSHNPRQSRTLMPSDASHQASFSGKSIYGASATGQAGLRSIAYITDSVMFLNRRSLGYETCWLSAEFSGVRAYTPGTEPPNRSDRRWAGSTLGRVARVCQTSKQVGRREVTEAAADHRSQTKKWPPQGEGRPALHGSLRLVAPRRAGAR